MKHGNKMKLIHSGQINGNHTMCMFVKLSSLSTRRYTTQQNKSGDKNKNKTVVKTKRIYNTGS